MAWRNLTWYPFSESSVLLNAPHESGIYALFNKTTWVYIGESKNIRRATDRAFERRRRMPHVVPDLTFSFELLLPVVSAWRLNEVLSEFRPVCNPRLD